ncbi:vacuolar fusion protein MON1-like protein [Blastocystis sp. subtype 4]|uniref:vacuolar fusion protein MON1-like protein n=1 Tax=Blastocystis sp. subtype 4 TaxID=944170 RepID=UPI000711603E|nr:vacuolar fusion protein MON1-like protein [Blastocystis sp. subtype 4]KNB43762.1 vacuolar fusion protein MON1-like protein [Blastocystis sp. subtype 4]|eukprot:XP_014527205.1 vacuolar fusion protein MON1-like protein [Blastocystis sp. subtype 4]
MEEVLQEKAKQFINTKKQIIILTPAGKPVYSYGYNEDDLAHISGIIQAIDANFSAKGETIKSIETEDGFFVIEWITSLLFFCYTPKEGTTVLLIHEQFHLLYQQLIILLSTTAMDRLQKKQNYDIRELLGSDPSERNSFTDSAGVLTTLIEQFDISLCYSLCCYQPVMMSPLTRSNIRDIFLRNKRDDTVYCGLGINEHIVVCLQNKSYPLQPMNQVLLQTMITKTVAYRTSEGWLPVCITDVRDNAFLHLYVGFVTDEMYVFFVTTAMDPDTFTQYSELKDRIYNVSICCIVHDQILLESDRLIELYSLYNESFSVVDTGVENLIHFAYKNDNSQIILPRLDERIYDYRDYHKLLIKYQMIFSYMSENNVGGLQRSIMNQLQIKSFMPPNEILQCTLYPFYYY